MKNNYYFFEYKLKNDYEKENIFAIEVYYLDLLE